MSKKRTSLFGYGKTTQALARVIKNAVFYDDNVKEPFVDKEKNIIRPSKEFEADFSDMEIPSPGIPPHHPLIQKAKHLISEYDYFKDVMNFKIWISGTNGKTTTTQMMHHLLADKGALAGGNIGTPLAELDQKAPIWILETSSFTLHYTQKAIPNIYVLLPITPDHLSWHGSMQEYEKAKLKPLAMMDKTTTVIIPKHYQDVATQAQCICYEDADDLAQQFDIDTKKIKFEGAFLLDAVLAMVVDTLVNQRISYETINTFTLEAHRQEEFFDRYNRLWVNDTKATNLDATIAAVTRYKDKKINLILGGDDKGVDLHPLFSFLQKHTLHIYAIGSNKHKLVALARQYNIPATLCENLQDAVHAINSAHTKESVALLSPAAASLDEFDSYAQRGEIFKKSVTHL